MPGGGLVRVFNVVAHMFLVEIYVKIELYSDHNHWFGCPEPAKSVTWKTMKQLGLKYVRKSISATVTHTADVCERMGCNSAQVSAESCTVDQNVVQYLSWSSTDIATVYISSVNDPGIVITRLWKMTSLLWVVEEWHLLGCYAKCSCKNWSFGGTYRLHHQGDKNRQARNNVSSN
jgi:hypothetical protein